MRCAVEVLLNFHSIVLFVCWKLLKISTNYCARFLFCWYFESCSCLLSLEEELHPVVCFNKLSLRWLLFHPHFRFVQPFSHGSQMFTPRNTMIHPDGDLSRYKGSLIIRLFSTTVNWCKFYSFLMCEKTSPWCLTAAVTNQEKEMKLFNTKLSEQII